MRFLALLALPIVLASAALAADSLDVAEAQKRGVPLSQVVAERERDQAQAKAATLARELAAAKADLAAAKKEIEKLKQSAKADPQNAAPPVPSTQPEAKGAAESDSSSKTVQVRGYTRKDGTYVAPYTRSAPRKGK